MATLTGADIVSILILSRTTNGRPPPAADSQRAAALWAAIAARFAAEADPRYRAASADFERRPARHQEAFGRLLDDLLARDPAFAAQLARLYNPPPARPPAPPPARVAPPRPTPAARPPVVKESVRNRSSRGAPLPAPLAELCDRLMAYFNKEELRNLALDLRLNHEDIPDEKVSRYSRGLVMRCWREGKLEALLAAAARLRPQADWAISLAGVPARPPREFDHDDETPFVQIVRKVVRSVFSDWTQVAVALGGLFLFIAIVYGANVISRQPERMTGEFNIAVAKMDLTALNATDADYGPLIIKMIATELENQLKSLGTDFQVSTDKMPLIHLNDVPAAARLAEKVNADVVIYGSAFMANDEVHFTPHFYVNDTDHPAVADLNGSDYLENSVSIPVKLLNPDNPQTKEIAARAALLTDFTQALVYLAFDDLRAARVAIDNAVERVKTDETLAGLAGYEVIYLYASHIARLAGDLPAAETHAQQALELSDNTYARGHIALGNIYYDQNPPQFAAAKTAYLAAIEQASILDDLVAQNLIIAKASLGLGNLALGSLSAIHGTPGLPCDGEVQPYAEEGLARFRAVVTAFEAADEQDPLLSALAGQAWAGIGDIHKLCGQAQDAAASYRAALALPLPPAMKKQIEAALADLEGVGG